MIKPALLFLSLLSSGATLAQKDSIQTRRLGYSFFGQGGINPGATFTYEKSLLSNDHLQLLEAGKAGLYFHYRNNTGFFVMIQSGARFRLYKNLYFEHFVGVGFLQTFLNGGDAYYVSASGQITKASKIGNPHFMPSYNFGLSFHASDKVTIFFRPMIYWEIPFNQSALVQYSFEVGTSIKMKRRTRKIENGRK
jgi:hypothetical protein